ncbi:unnamed protein product [Urochloa humidicola]
MDPSLLDQSPGEGFAAKVRSLTGSLVASSHPSETDNFWLIAAFSRSTIRLSTKSVGGILQAVLGVKADLFCVVELEEHVFKFGVSSKVVGLLVYNLRSFACSAFKVFFHLWNERGVSSARISVLTDRGPRFEWTEVQAKGKKKSYAQALNTSVINPKLTAPTRPPRVKVSSNPLTGVNRVPIRQKQWMIRNSSKPSVFSRLDFRAVSDQNLVQGTAAQPAKNKEQAKNKGPFQFSNGDIDLELNLGPVKGINAEKFTTSGPSMHSLSANQGRLGRNSCSRCLSTTHTRPTCRSRIRCIACYRLGHIAESCHFQPRFPSKSSPQFFSNQKSSTLWKDINFQNWFGKNPSLPYRPPIVSTSFTELCQKLQGPTGDASASAAENLLCSTLPLFGTSPEQPLHLFVAATADPSPQHQFNLSPEHCLATAAGPTPSPTACPTRTQKTPSPATVNPTSSGSPAMAYRFVDPTPFMPLGCNRVIIPNRRTMTRAVMDGLRGQNDDLAIATIEPLPGNQVLFHSIREVLDDFLRNVRGVRYRKIQPSTLGQASVRFEHLHDRDFLIHDSPHEYGDLRISFIEHDKGWNHRAVTFNHEVWLMLLGLNNDFWSEKNVEKALADFGKLITWKADPNYLARILVKARVVDLEEIPWFIVCTDGDRFEGESWTAQCEVLQTRMLGGGPGDEDQPPAPDDLDPSLFHFFGFGQPGQGANNQVGDDHMNVEGGQQEGMAGNLQNNEVQGWGNWPDGPQGQQLPEPFIGPMPPPHQQPGVPFFELNDLQQQEGNGNGIGFDLNQPMEEDLGSIVDLAQDVAPLVAEGNLQVLNPEQVIDEGIPSDDSVNQLPAPLPDLNEVNQVEVFIPMNNGSPLQMIPDEVQPEELMGQAPEQQAVGEVNQLQGPAQMADQQEVDPTLLGLIQGAQQVQAAQRDNEDGIQEEHQDMHIGMVQNFQPHMDPVFAAASSTFTPPTVDENIDAISLWAKHFAPGVGAPSVTIPKQWADFFTTMLMNPGCFEWAKSFLSSAALEALLKPGQPVVHYSLPEKCPSTATPGCFASFPNETSVLKGLSPSCSPTAQEKGLSPTEKGLSPTCFDQSFLPDTLQQELEKIPSSKASAADKGKEAISSPSTPQATTSLDCNIPAGPWSKAFLAQAIATKNRPALVDTEVRRSGRKKEHHKGYKHSKTTCADPNCLGCIKNPPTLSPSAIRNLGETFCKIDSEKLSEKALVKKRKVVAPSEKAPGKAKSGKGKEKDDDDQQKKNIKKHGKK